MKTLRWLAALPFALCAASTPVRADAAPSIWEKAKEKPKPPLDLRDALTQLSVDEVHRQAGTLYTLAMRKPSRDPLAISWLSGARTLLEENGAATSPDVRLRYDLGLVLARAHHCVEAVKVLDSALKMAPEHTFAEDGWFELAICSALLGNHVEEERAYLGALKVTDSHSRRATIYSNLSESRMAQGKIAAAIDAAETSIELEPDHPAASWNLAILRDRADEPAAALEAARHALEYDPELEGLTGDGVFFEPEYEREWYLALSELALAEREKGESRTMHLMAALARYQLWLEAAAPDDRFRTRALENVARLEKQLKLKSGAKPMGLPPLPKP